MSRSPHDELALKDFETKLKAWQEEQLLEAPEQVRRVANVVRISVATGSTRAFGKFLRKYGIDVQESRLEQFRDYLITRRHDLKDLEPAARNRLRRFILKDEDPTRMTSDYKMMQAAREQPFCRDCRYFVEAPHDGEPDGEKACVEFGTKGADLACYGFTTKSN